MDKSLSPPNAWQEYGVSLSFRNVSTDIGISQYGHRALTANSMKTGNLLKVEDIEPDDVELLRYVVLMPSSTLRINRLMKRRF